MNVADFRALAARKAEEGSLYAAAVLEMLDSSDDPQATIEALAAQMLASVMEQQPPTEH